MGKRTRWRAAPKGTRGRRFVLCLSAVALAMLMVTALSRPEAVSSVSAQEIDPPGGIEARIDDLIGRITLEEKLGQLSMLDADYPSGEPTDEQKQMVRDGVLGSTLNGRGAVATNEAQRIAVEESRLGIPLIFGFDVIHGYRTVFPMPLAEAATWSVRDARRSAAIAAKEARAAGVTWTFAPMVDITHDARWGRIVEGAGEDPFMGSAFSRARVKGFQGDDYSRPDRVAATAKHWVAYGGAEAGRDYNTVDTSERNLRELYFPPFKAAHDAGVDSFMTAFNEISGILATANPFTLTMNGRPLDLNWLHNRAPAVVEAWYPGTQAGHAVADVLFGKVNPGGKLPVSFPRAVGQIPLYYSQKPTGRPPNPENKYTSQYLDVPVTSLYEFGFGLSYTDFEISNVRLSAPSISPGGSLTVSADVANIGSRSGDEVVQLYVHDKVASVTRPIAELRGFKRVNLDTGEEKTVTFSIDETDLAFWGQENTWVVEPGEFDVWVGDTSAVTEYPAEDDELHETFTLNN